MNQITEKLIEILTEDRYTVKTIGNDIEVKGKVITPTIRKLVNIAGYNIIESNYRSLVGTRKL